MSKQTASPRTVAREQQRENAIGLRVAGATYREIGRALNVSRQTSLRLIHEALEQQRGRNSEETEKLRSLELHRLDAITWALWPKKHEPRHALAILRASERRARLLGLDAPVKLQAVDPGDAEESLDLSAFTTDELLVWRTLMAKARNAPPPGPVALPPASEQTVEVAPEE